jgi:hypothetical protein
MLAVKVELITAVTKKVLYWFANDIYFGDLRLAWVFDAMFCLCVQFLDTAVKRQRRALQTSTKCNLPSRNSEVLKSVQSSDTAYGLE